MSHFKRTQAKCVKTQYKVTNWPAYEEGLRKRGSLTVWICEDELAGWGPTGSKRKAGGQRRYSNRAMETAATIRMVYHQPLRQTEGFLRSLFKLLNVTAPVPDHTTISRRSKKLGKLPISAREITNDKPIHLIVDSSGLKVHVGQLRQPPKRRDWRKLHIGVDSLTGEILASNLTSKGARDPARVPALLKQIGRPIASCAADTAYDTEDVYATVENHRDDRSPRVLVPPQRDAKLRPTSAVSRERNRNISSRARLGKRKWQDKSGYNKRARVECTFSRYKRILGPTMRARNLAAQRVESRIGCRILNRMTALGMPCSERVD